MTLSNIKKYKKKYKKIKVLNHRAQVTFMYPKNACLHCDSSLGQSAQLAGMHPKEPF
jgi:hypothetical protein